MTWSAAMQARTKSNLLTRLRMTSSRRLRAGDRRRQWFRAPRDDLHTPMQRGPNEQYIGINPATKWSPELAPVSTSAAVHGGQTSISSYGAWSDAKISSEDAYAHPSTEEMLGDADCGRRRWYGRRFRRTTANGNAQIGLLGSAPGCSAPPRWSLRRGASSRPLLGARYGLNRHH
jgi:hypothetical protein